MQVYFKPEEVTYERLLDEFFAKVDPTTMNRQGNDMGTQYRSVSCETGAERESSACAELSLCSVVPTVFVLCWCSSQLLPQASGRDQTQHAASCSCCPTGCSKSVAQGTA